MASPAEAFASDTEPTPSNPNSETSLVEASSPAQTASLELTTYDPSTVEAGLASSAAQEAAAAKAAADAKATAIAKKNAAAKKAAAAKKRAAESKKLVSTAKSYLGVRYKRGGTSPRTGFDCSGFTRYVYKKAGKSIPRTSSAQRHAGKTIARKWARPGDLVWFSDFRHVAIYAGNGYIIDAPEPGKKVSKRKLWTSHVKYIRVAA
ncbi:MAG TPA: C40 family peptidase [Phycisphaerales bacterium]|nr:C40 family peptidase [Phycisphaerales bacterium]